MKPWGQPVASSNEGLDRHGLIASPNNTSRPCVRTCDRGRWKRYLPYRYGTPAPANASQAAREGDDELLLIDTSACSFGAHGASVPTQQRIGTGSDQW